MPWLVQITQPVEQGAVLVPPQARRDQAGHIIGAKGGHDHVQWFGLGQCQAVQGAARGCAGEGVQMPADVEPHAEQICQLAGKGLRLVIDAHTRRRAVADDGKPQGGSGAEGAAAGPPGFGQALGGAAHT